MASNDPSDTGGLFIGRRPGTGPVRYRDVEPIWEVLLLIVFYASPIFYPIQVITGRKKDIIITAGGKNITPANLENGLKQNRWISQAVVIGDRRPYLIALITLDPEEAGALAEQVGAEDASLPALAENEAVRAEVQTAVDEVNAHVGPVEQIKRFEILDHDLSQETGELTPTLKVKRNVVHEKYADVVDGIYGGPR